jgi:DNA-binding response OmpR family regulator
MQVLLVYSDPTVTFLIETVLTREGMDVRAFRNTESAVAALQQYSFDVIVLDADVEIARPFYDTIREVAGDTRVLLISGRSTRALREALDADASLERPFDPGVLVEQIRELAHRPA